MPATFDSTGLDIQTLDEIVAELAAAARSPDGVAADAYTGDDSPLGQLLAIMAEREHDVQELVQAVVDAFDKEAAQGISLDNLVGLVGLTRKAASKATGTITAVGTSTTVLSTGRIVRKSTQQDHTFVTTADGTITAVSAWAPTTAYSVGDRVTNGGNVYECDTAGVSAGAGGPTGTGSDIVDGSARWDYLGAGDGAVDIAAEAENAGAIDALTGLVDEIVTPVAGWNAVTNRADFTPGTDVETDAALRERMEVSLQIIGAATDGAIRARLLELTFLTAALVISNRTLTPDSNGIPGKAFRAVVWPDTISSADKQSVAGTIFASMPAGIEPDGTESYTVTDEQGLPQTVKYSFATEVVTHVDVTATETGTDLPTDAVAQIVAAVVAYGAGLSIGDDVEYNALICAVQSAVPGLVAWNLKIGTVDPPTGTTNVTIAPTQIATIDSGDVDVTLP